MLARARPFRHDRREKIERTEPFAAQVGVARETCRRTRPTGDEAAGACRRRCACVSSSSGVAAVTLGIIDDADRRVAIGRDVDEAADRLRRACHRQQTAFRMREAQMDEDRRAFRHHRAVGQHERRDLRERIHARQLVEARARLPRRGIDHAERNAGEDERRLDGGGARALAAVERVASPSLHVGHATVHLFGRHVLDVRGDRPHVAERIDERAAAVAVELVDDGRSCLAPAASAWRKTRSTSST